MLHLDAMHKLAADQGGVAHTRIKFVRVDGKRTPHLEVKKAPDQEEAPTLLAPEPTAKLVQEVEMPGAVFSSTITANGVLYVGMHTHLYAVAAPKE